MSDTSDVNDACEEDIGAGSAAPSSRPRPGLRSTINNQRSEFLRRCRQRLSPEEVGLGREKRARGGGLRREDVASLSGVSASWYTWLEQGRDIRVSDEVLERVSNTLRLSDEERTYLFSLVQHRLPKLGTEMLTVAPPDVERLMNALPIPAVILNLRCDVLAWNAVNSVLYRDYTDIPPEDRNLLEILFIRPVRHMSPTQQETMARKLIGRLRFDFSKCSDDPKFELLLRRLLAQSPIFRKLWRMQDFTLRAYGPHTFNHPRFGEVVFEHTSYIPDGYPTIRVVLCTPLNPAAHFAVGVVNAELAAARAKPVVQA